MAHDIYLSFASEDQTAAKAVCAELEAQNIQCWMAPRDIVPGERWSDAITEAIRSARVVVFIVSSHSNVAEKTKSELSYAAQENVDILTFRIEDVLPGNSISFFIAGRQSIDAFSRPLEQHLGALSEAVKCALADASEKGPELREHLSSPTPAETEPDRPRATETVGNQRYNVFVSYRREVDDITARFFYDRLTERGFDVFLDVVSLVEGRFDQRLFREIESAHNFLLLLSPGALDRCLNEGDWLREEIAHAITTKRNIVPIFRNNFTFPNTLPDQLAPLRGFNAISYSPDYVDATFDRVDRFLRRA